MTRYENPQAELIRNDIAAYLKQHEEKDMLRFLAAGSVDDGKSTLIGRLLYDAKMIYEDQLAALHKDSAVHGTTNDDFDPALLTDGLKAEREQGITIDVAYRYFSTEKRNFIICDAPGHEQYTRNMATGASHCDLAIILIDARHGVMPQTKRHSFIASLLGINHFIPVSALKGENVVDPSPNMTWHHGAPLLPYLEDVEVATDRNLIDFRFPVQYVIRPDLNFRGYAGTVASGIVRPGQELMVLPAGTRTRVKTISTYDGELDEAFPPMAVTITTEDEVDISRGDMLCHINNVPHVGNCIEAMVVWMSETPMKPGANYLLKCCTNTVPATINELRYKFDINTLARQDADTFELNEIGRCMLTVHRPLCFDSYARNRQTGAFILIDRITNITVGAGMILEHQPNERLPGTPRPHSPENRDLLPSRSRITPEQRQARLNQKPFTIWLTGLPGAGKTTLAYALEERLFELGYIANVLDGQNLRLGISSDLGFSGMDRTENIRRAAEVARVCNDAGLITIAAFVSPYAADRAAAREIIGKDRFIEVFIDTPIELCEQRCPELYAKARAGEISNFSGITAPYEAPESPALTLPVQGELQAVLEHLEANGFVVK